MPRTHVKKPWVVALVITAQGDADRQTREMQTGRPRGTHWLASLAYGGNYRPVRDPDSKTKRHSCGGLSEVHHGPPYEFAHKCAHPNMYRCAYNIQNI